MDRDILLANKHLAFYGNWGFIFMLGVFEKSRKSANNFIIPACLSACIIAAAVKLYTGRRLWKIFEEI
jgi:hypothetical protein